MKKFFLSAADRNELSRLLSAVRSAPAPAVSREVPQKTFQEGDTYWALPPCETGLPAAEFVGDKWTSYGVTCCLFWKDPYEHQMEPLLDAVGNPAREEVWNHYPRPEMGLVQVFKHKAGYWTNERPLSSSSVAGDPNSTTASPDNPCGGKCVWTADAAGVWQWPTGDCVASSTTSTTTGAPTTTGTRAYNTNPPAPVPTTIAPCTDTPCTLVCVDTSTTPAPNEFGVPVPYTRNRYALKAGSVCPTGCTCYGLGDPCFLVDGELVSKCIGEGPTTTSTTTPSPDATPCEQAEFIFGTVPPNIKRVSFKFDGGVEECSNCAGDAAAFYNPGVTPYREHNWRTLATVHEAPCVQSPCTINRVIDDKATFVAFPYTDQFNRWGVELLAVKYDVQLGLRANRYLGNWFLCNPTGSKTVRPSSPPPLWIYDIDDTQSALNTDRGITLEDGVYVYRTPWVQGENCNNCSRGQTVLNRKVEVIEPGGSTTSTTTGTTTTAAPCGCIRPLFCPQPFECTITACVRGGEVVNGTPGTTRVPSVPCFPDATTTSTTTATPSTTNGPNQCIGTDGRLCICTTGTPTTTVSPPTLPPSGPRCPPGSRYEPPTDPCGFGRCVPTTTPPIGDPPPPRPCFGWCECTATATGAWSCVGACEGADSAGDCGCLQPEQEPTACGQKVTVGCGNRTPPTSTSTTTGGPGTTTPNPCACCNPPTTTPNPCPTRTCRYRSNAARRWVLVANSCLTGCPCPDPSGLPLAAEECETFTAKCGSVLPPPSTSPPTTSTTTGTSTTSTTTPSPLGCCGYQLGGGIFRCDVRSRISCGPPLSGATWLAFPSACTYVSPSISLCLTPTTTPAPTTAPPTTTPAATTTGTTTTTTSDPCVSCPYIGCGCASSGIEVPSCPPGATFSCTLCLCVAATTTGSGVTSTAPPE